MKKPTIKSFAQSFFFRSNGNAWLNKLIEDHKDWQVTNTTQKWRWLKWEFAIDLCKFPPPPKKVAVIISGHMRTYKKCAASQIKYLIKPLDADVFISTWNTLGFAARKIPKQYRSQEGPFDAEDITKYYGEHVKNFNVEDHDSLAGLFDRMEATNPSSGQPNSIYPVYQGQHSIQKIKRLISMWYKVFDANRLREEYEKEEEFQYETIIRIRPDLLFENSCLINPIPGAIYFPAVQTFSGWNDQFAIGKRDEMSTYCRLYERIDQYISQGVTVVRSAENLVKEHFRCSGLRVERCPVRYDLCRG